MKTPSLLLLALCLSSCVSTETTAPDGTRTRTTTPDFKSINLIAGAVGQAAAQAKASELRAEQERSRR